MTAVAASMAVLGFCTACPAQSLSGSGSSFVGPIMSRWARDYEKAKDIKINYTLTGSGAGIRQVLEKEVDFGCTDALLTEEQTKKALAAGGDVVYVPLVLGGVVPAYNLEEVKDPLRLDGPVLADIFLGNIKKWNDPAIKEINPGVDLPAKDVKVIYRSDASGTTAIFTDYLSKVSNQWKEKVGHGTGVKFPVGDGERGNEDVAAAISKTPGAIGYVDLLHALRQRIKHAAVKNKEGRYVQGSLEGVSAAAEGALTEIPADLRFSLTNAEGKDAYPISGATWAILYAKQSEARGKRLLDFLTYATHDGQEAATDLYYARLPKGLVAKIDEKLKTITTGK
jgi:phosphate transport system substrate-binding protein